jgi:cytosine/adenosine deaminase-related metal-dependent hydrolase
VSEVSADWVLPVDGPPIEGGLVRYEEGAIVEVIPGRAERHYADAAIVPGFVNAHSHLEYAMYAGFGDGQAFGPWIATHIERKNRLDPSDMVAIARAGVLESLRAGITTTADYSFSGAAAIAAAALGLRAIVFLEVFALDPAEAQRQFEDKRAWVEENAVEENGLGERLVRLGVSPHAPYTCSLETYRWCLSLGIPVGTHLAESSNENEWLEHGSGPLQGIAPLLVAPTGQRAVSSLEPVLGPDLLCAHCVEVNAEEIALLSERNVPVAHCPRSNALLGCGIAPVAELRAADVRVGLGTDSPASTPSFDMFEEMRTAIYVARARGQRPEALLAADVLQMSTLDAARALRIEDRVGTLTPGKRADLTVVSLAGSPYHPVEDPAAAVVFGGSPERVLETIVDGHTRYANEDNEQWREVRSTASAARQRMLAPRQ